MAERRSLTVVQKPSKTQESMRSKLKEWRKTRQQQTAKQLKQQPFPRTPGVYPKLSQQNATNTKSSSKEASLSEPSLSVRKRKSIHLLKCDRHTKIKDENTAEVKACKIVHDDLNIKEIKSKHSTIQKENLSEAPSFQSRPPESFEIEITPDPKNARRSTFTIETPMKDVGVESKENLDACGNNKQNLRNKLEVWRESKRKSARPSIQKGLKPQIKPQTICKAKDGLASKKNGNKTVDPGKHRQVSTARKREENKILEPPKRKAPSTQVEKASQDTKIKAKPKDNKVSLPRTPVKLPHMDKSLSMRARLELWRKEKGIAQGVSKTPATLRRKSTMTAIKKHHQPIAMDTKEPLELFDTMTCDMVEKEPTPEEIRKRLQDCLEKLQEDKSDDMIANQLDEIHKCHPGALQCAEYWICRAKIAEHEEDDGRVVCLYEQALVFNAEPEQLIKEAVAEYSKTRKGQEEETEEEVVLPAEVPEDVSTEEPAALFPITPHREVDALTQAGQPSPLYSSVIKYSVTKATPFKSRLKSCERPVVTPVRRSARLERRSIHYPTMLQEHGLAVRHLDDLPEDIKKDVLFKPNFTVQNDLNEAWKDLWNE